MEIEQALDRRQRRVNKPVVLAQVSVVSVDGGSPPTITIEHYGNISGVRYLASYSPVVGDSAWALIYEPDILVLGDLA